MATVFTVTENSCVDDYSIFNSFKRRCSLTSNTISSCAAFYIWHKKVILGCYFIHLHVFGVRHRHILLNTLIIDMYPYFYYK